MRTWADTDIAWMAGLLENRGGVHVHTNHKRGKKYTYPQLRFSSIDEDLVERVAILLGNSVHSEEKQDGWGDNPVYFTQTYGSVAREMLESVLPYLGRRRRAEIREVLDATE